MFKKVAIVYDRVNKWGGAERVLLTLHEMFPSAPLYTSVFDEKNASWAKVFPKIYTSFLQKIPFLRNKHELVGWLMPIVFEQFDFSKYDLVISVTSESAKGIITKPSTYHVCYCLTPTRYLWSGYGEYFKGVTFQGVTKSIVNYLKKWDIIASQRPDKIIAISTVVQERVKKYYKRDSEIIFPPVATNYKKSFLRGPDKPAASHDFFDNAYLIVSRLVKYKKVDLAIRVFNKLNLPLVVVGVGNEEKYLKSIASKNIKFVGSVNDNELFKHYSNTKAFLMPQLEDFGITAVEAQSFGVPVIAFAKGGALDTVINVKTGVFFFKQNINSLMQAVKKFARMSFNRIELLENAKRFNQVRFKRELQRSLVRAYSSWRRGDSSLAKISK